jgi:hypothetical protein
METGTRRWLGFRCLLCEQESVPTLFPNGASFWEHLRDIHQNELMDEHGSWVTEKVDGANG